MSQGFKLRFDQMRDNNPGKPDNEQEPVSMIPDNSTMHAIGYARNLCLVWPDGRRAFYNYAYLVSAELEPGGEINQIKLSFSSQTVVLKGYSLEGLFMQLLDHTPRIITAVDKRYIGQDSGSESIVISIEIEKDEG